MHIIIGIVLAAGALWLWLSAHWFGRVLALLGIGPVVILIAAATGTPWSMLAFLIIGSPIAWAIASAPIWIARRATQAG